RAALGGGCDEAGRADGGDEGIGEQRGEPCRAPARPRSRALGLLLGQSVGGHAPSLRRPRGLARPACTWRPAWVQRTAVTAATASGACAHRTRINEASRQIELASDEDARRRATNELADSVAQARARQSDARDPARVR